MPHGDSCLQVQSFFQLASCMGSLFGLIELGGKRMSTGVDWTPSLLEVASTPTFA